MLIFSFCLISLVPNIYKIGISRKLGLDIKDLSQEDISLQFAIPAFIARVNVDNYSLDANRLDETIPECVAKENILINYAKSNENLIVTPHTAWISKEARQRLVEQVAGNIKGFLEGGKFNRVC